MQLLPSLFCYCRLFGSKCAKCNQGFNKKDYVMRVKNKIFHMDCFRCVACSKQLVRGEEFALREDGLFCKADHTILEKAREHYNTENLLSINTGKSAFNILVLYFLRSRQCLLAMRSGKLRPFPYKR